MIERIYPSNAKGIETEFSSRFNKFIEQWIREANQQVYSC